MFDYLKVLVLCIYMLFAILSTNTLAAHVGYGNMLVIHLNSVEEYTKTWTFVQSILVRHPEGERHIGESIRDITVTNFREIQVYNWTADPYLSSFDPKTGTWKHRTEAGWSTGKNASYGGIATLDPYTFVTDMRTFGDSGIDRTQGIIRFEIENS